MMSFIAIELMYTYDTIMSHNDCFNHTTCHTLIKYASYLCFLFLFEWETSCKPWICLWIVLECVRTHMNLFLLGTYSITSKWIHKMQEVSVNFIDPSFMKRSIQFLYCARMKSYRWEMKTWVFNKRFSKQPDSI